MKIRRKGTHNVDDDDDDDENPSKSSEKRETHTHTRFQRDIIEKAWSAFLLLLNDKTEIFVYSHLLGTLRHQQRKREDEQKKLSFFSFACQR